MDGISAAYSTGKKEIVRTVFLATGMCQHRGKACSGIAVGNGKGIHIHKELGRIGDVIDSDLIHTYQSLDPVAAIGNVGYTKNTIPSRNNAEPIKIYPKKHSNFEIVLTMNGYLVKENDLKEELQEDYYLNTTNKTEVVGALLHKYLTEEQKVSFEVGKKLIDKLHGRATFSLAAIVYDGKESKLITINDDRAFEPFCYSFSDDLFLASSESVSHQRLKIKNVQEYKGAEMTISSSRGLETKVLRNEILLPDKFQSVYFGNASAIHCEREMYKLRNELGNNLAKIYPTRADVIIANPESGWGVSSGIADGLNIKLRPGLVKLAQAVRTFLESEKKKRYTEVDLKFSGIRSELDGKYVIMGDDSIVKGSVGEGGSIRVIFDCGVKGLEFWISYGPMIFPSFKEWHRGPECLNELAVRRAFISHPYDKSLEEINNAVSNLIISGLKESEERDYNFKVRYNPVDSVKKILGPGSFQALDASYPISENFWPDWLKKEVELYYKFQN